MNDRIRIADLRAELEAHGAAGLSTATFGCDALLALVEAVEAAHALVERLSNEGKEPWNVAPAAAEWLRLHGMLANRFDFGAEA